MDSTQITIQAFVDSNMYVSFALFDMLHIQKRWIRPAIFAAFFSCLSLLAFWRTSEVEGATLLGSVLLAVGIGLPVVYFGSFFLFEFSYFCKPAKEARKRNVKKQKYCKKRRIPS